jgi:hypothetical protein
LTQVTESATDERSQGYEEGATQALDAVFGILSTSQQGFTPTFTTNAATATATTHPLYNLQTILTIGF